MLIHPGSDSPLISFTTPTVPPEGRNVFDVTGAQTDVANTFGAGSVVPNAVSALDALRLINVKNSGGVFQNNVTFFGSTPVIEDVNGSGFVSALDALLVINYLNSGEPAQPKFEVVASVPQQNDIYALTLEYRYLNPQNSNAALRPRYLDVNGDGTVTASDALAVINRLNNPY